MIAQLKKDFELMNSMGLIVRSHDTIQDKTRDKKAHRFLYFMYDKEEPRNLIKFQSNFNENKNSLHILTGELHGGYIGIDVDNKPGQGKLAHAVFLCACIDELPYTLVCKTPNRGYHYVFKLSDEQRKQLTHYKSKQAKLFDQDIDVLYNAGRFVMSGSYDNNTDGCKSFKSEYVITQKYPPAILPNVIFNEIIRKDRLKVAGMPKTLKLKPIKKVHNDAVVKDAVVKNDKSKDNILIPYLDCLDMKQGIFNEAGYEIDHIKEFSISHDNSEENLQALCPICHSFKTKKFMNNLKKQKDKKALGNKYDYTHILHELEPIYVNDYVNERRIAKLIYKLYPDKYIYDSDYKRWYELNENNVYQETDRSLFSLRDLIENEIMNIIIIYINDKQKQLLKKAKTEKHKAKINSHTQKKQHKIEKFLNSETRNDLIIRSMAKLCERRGFYEEMRQTIMKTNKLQNDPISSFVEECLTITTKNHDKIMSSDLYNEYKFYSKESKIVNTVKFKKILESLNIVSHRERIGTVYSKLVFKIRPSDQVNIDFVDDEDDD